VLVIAHRTCPRDAAENSIAGIRRAAELGADLVEVDVRCTSDDVPVLMHDPTALRTTGVPLPVGRVPSRILRRLRLLRGREHVPTLTDALDALDALGPSLGIAIDIKDPSAGDAVVEAVHTAQPGSRVLLWSQHRGVVEQTARAAPELESSLLRDTTTDDEHQRFLDDAVVAGARGVSVHWNAVSADFLADAESRGLSVYSWFRRRPIRDSTVDAAFAAKSTLPLTGVVSDWPGDVRGALAGS
jgi:glycerophosphoryl diester phosphodiesterase